jgi:2-dehydro-3-deoxyphosphogluconate aldolase/(4S)-4-hydroxy-2-oxoglutarate aldolase
LETLCLTYFILEILGRPMDKACDLLRAFNDRPERSNICMAVGTLRTRAHAEAVVALKPDFVVSAIFSRPVLDVAAEAGIPYVPAVSTLQGIHDVMEAFEELGLDLRVLKICPLDWVTVEVVDIMSAIFPGIAFCPTGTVQIADIADLKAKPWMGAAMERWFVPDELIFAHDWEAIRTILRTIEANAAQGIARRA